MEAVAQQRGDAGPGHAARDAREQHGGRHPGAAAGPGEQRDAAAGQRAEHELALGADVPDVGTEADRQPETDQQQRRCLEQQLADRVGRAQRLPEEDLQALERVLAQQREQRHPHQHRDGQRQQRRGIAPPGRGLGAHLNLEHEQTPSFQPPPVHRPTGPTSRRRCARRWPRRAAGPATAARPRSRAAGRRSRAARRARR